MKQTIKFFTLAVALILSAASEAWAYEKLSNNGVTIYVDKTPTEGGTISNPPIVSDISGGKRTVTLTITANDGYAITEELITATPIVSPGALSRTRAQEQEPGLMEEAITITAGSGNTYSFDLKSKYNAVYVTATFKKGTIDTNIKLIRSLEEITNPAGNYEMVADIDASGFQGLKDANNVPITEFTGTLNGNFHKITYLEKPLFTTINGGTVKNITFENVAVSTDGDAGTVACEMIGTSSKIAVVYNCGILSGSVKGGNSSGKVGGLIGKLGQEGGTDATNANCYARVINCYSFANIESGYDKGGIVGYNCFSSKSDNIRSMVMNCMFYGDIVSGSNVSPVYGGEEITNVSGDKGLNTYTYYRFDSDYSSKVVGTNYGWINKHNCSLAVEEKYLVRFEFYRQLLNSNRPLAAWYALTDEADGAKRVERGKYKNNEMAKWVLDRTIAPYPILKKQGTYYSVVNYDPNYTFDEEGKQVSRNSSTIKRSQGKYLGKSLSITISEPNTQTGGKKKPDNAQITVNSLSRPCIDKDTLNYNFNYDKVQLPYYNEVGTGNYTKNTSDGKSRVVTGWMITGVTTSASDENSYTADNYPAAPTAAYNTATYDAPNYNFADRKSSQKDLYKISGRIFSQGAYFDVPYNVTGITIEPYWGDAAYVSDSYLDVTYTADDGKDKTYKSKTDAVFRQYAPVAPATYVTRKINGVDQNVYTSISNALGQLGGTTVYDNAVVLVGNLHQSDTPSTGTKAFTVMSADLDFDNEPDYSMIYHHCTRKDVAPIRYDFLNIPGTAMTQKPKGASDMLNMSIYNLKGWFEVTNTCNVSFVQFEYYNGASKVLAPVIFQGGMVDQFVSTKTSSPVNGTGKKPFVNYIHVGGNAWFKDFGNGTHSDGSQFTPHIPISVTGGDFENFYLSGTYKPGATVQSDNAEGYISGGRFGEVAGAAQQQIAGDVNWQIYDADIRDFYGGGINADKPITGDITVYIYNSHVTTYCGGPKFGDMAGVDTESTSDDKTVRTIAKGCTFGRYFGAGYGGTSYLRKRYYDEASADIASQESYYTNERGKYYDGGESSPNTPNNKDGKKGPGIATDFDYELFTWSDGRVGSRFYVKFASFSLAKTNDVHSELENCTVIGSYYGGGHLGEVTGTAYSKLDGCKVYGNVFGGGYSAEVPKVPVRDGGFATAPKYLTDAGVLTKAKFSDTHDYVWTTHALPNNGNLAINPNSPASTGNAIYTTDGLSTLGQVKEAQLTITGNTYVRGMIDGTVPKPEEDLGYSGIDGKTLYGVATGGKLIGGVFGGGDASKVSGNASVSIVNTISTNDGINNVYGGGNTADVLGDATVSVVNGKMIDVYGGGRGDVTVVKGDVTVHIGKSFKEDGTTVDKTGSPTISGNVYGGSALGVVNAESIKGPDGNITGYTPTEGKTTAVNIYGCTSIANVFGGGLGQLESGTSEQANYKPSIAAQNFGDVTVTMEGGKVNTAIYGGSNENGVLKGKATVTLKNGTVGTAVMSGEPNNVVFGGGKGQPTLVEGDVEINIGETTQTEGGATINGSVYGGSALGNVNATKNGTAVEGTTKQDPAYPADPTKTIPTETTVTLNRGTVNGDVYGGGLGYLHSTSETESDDVAANVYGPVTVTVNGGTARNVFGCNNVYGTPKSTVDVTVNGTNATEVNSESGDKTYALKGVYGGGNLAHYDPTTPSTYPTVTVNGCNTSIEDVFGGGNAAAVPYTHVTINGGDINRVFAGGNGDSGTPAHVGWKTTDAPPTDADIYTGTYEGAGTANLEIKGGTINQVFGGSNANGSIRVSSSININKSTTENACDMMIGEVYGGGNLANGNASTITIGCTGSIVAGENGHAAHPENIGTTLEGIGVLYGGANQADVGTAEAASNITLNINSGIVANVFGGNNTSGNIYGTITVNIEKNDATCGWYVGNVFGGGNLAAYTGSPVVNIKNGTVSGNVYGGGAGVLASGNDRGVQGKVTGNPQVTIGDATEGYVAIVSGDVYGGGDAADVAGTPVIVVAEKCNTEIGHLYGGGNAADVTGSNITINGGTIGDAFGGGHGDKTVTEEPLKYADVNGGVTFNVNGGKIDRVFAGSNSSGTITGTSNLTINKTSTCDMIIREVYGGGNEAAGKASTINIQCTGELVTGDDGHAAHPENIGTTLEGIGSVYGGANKANIGATGNGNESNIEVNVNSGIVANVFGGNNTSGTIYGTITVNIEKNDAATCAANWYVGNVYGGGNEAAYTGSPKVNIKNGTVSGNVYGGGLGSTAVVTGTPEVKVGDLTAPNSAYQAIVLGDVYGGGEAAPVTGGTSVTLQKANSSVRKLFGGGNAAGVSGNSVVTMTLGSVTDGVYGGCNSLGSIGGDASVTLTGGSIGSGTINETTKALTYTKQANVYGGGFGHSTYVNGDVEVIIGNDDGGPTIFGDVYGGSAQGHVNATEKENSDVPTFNLAKSTTVDLKNGTINGNVYGGGHGLKQGVDNATANVPAYVGGDVTVTLEGAALYPTYDNGNEANGQQSGVTGQIFGGNNLQGSPKGHVTVHIKSTQGITKTATVARDSRTEYDVAAVYGGGNRANYEPDAATTKKNTEVIIEGCDATAIKYVYGGGNAASVPATDVTVYGSYIIDVLYGGGNGINTAADVNGITDVKLIGGDIHKVYGGSNSQGNVAGGTNVTMPSKPTGTDVPDCCNDLDVREIYGAGNNASQDGGATVVLGCVNGLDVVYGGAKSANIKGGVNLVVTSGTFKKVFGGNDTEGTIQGPINLYIEETGCDPLVIGELYLGGKLAPYSVYGYKQGTSGLEPRRNSGDGVAAEGTTAPPTSTGQYPDPVLHVTSFTSIGNIYGGGLGATAVLYGNPTIEINEVVGRHADIVDGYPKDANDQDITALDGVAIPQHSEDAIGAIGNVYGGGNLATVYGSTKVNIGTETTVGFKTEPVHLRPSTAPTTPLTKNATTGLYDIPVDGVNITGNVYGGGNEADVTVDTQVNICAKETGTGTNKTWTSVTPGSAGVTIGENVFGGGKGIASDVTKAHVPATNIHIGNGAIKKSVYGGGELAQVEGNTNVTVMGGTIGTAKADLPSGVTMGAVYGNIYGGGMGNTTNSAAGQIKGNTNVNINNGTILHNIYGGGAYGSVGTFTYDATSEMPTALATENTGVCNVTITGGTIGTDGHENGMVFGSSRGDVAKPVGTPAVDPNDKLAWVYDANVIIGTSGATTGPQINGSVYGSGENGHTYNNTDIKVYSGTIGVNSSANVTIYDLLDNTKKVYEGKAYNYPYRGNVYGGGCGTDTYKDGSEDKYNPLAGVVQGTTSVTITGGTVVHNIYGAGALGSVGKTTKDGNDIVISSGGTTTIEISGGIVGVDGDGNGNVFGAARGDETTTQAGIALVKTTNVIISGDAAIKGNVYGGGQVGDVGTYHTVTEEGLNKGNNNYLGGDASGVCNVVVTGGTIGTEGTTTAGNVFGAGKGVANTYTCQKAMVKETSVTISDGTIYGDVYGGGEVGRVEHDSKVTIGLEPVADGSITYYEKSGDTYSEATVTAGTTNVVGKYIRSGVAGSYVYIPIVTSDVPTIYGNVFGAGAGMETHGYSALVRGNSTVTIGGSAAVRKNVYGGGKAATVGKYWVSHFSPDPNETPPTGFPDGMPYKTRDGGFCRVTIQGQATIGPASGDASETEGQVFGAGKGVNPRSYTFTGTDKPSRMNEGGMEPLNTKGDYFQFLETLALASNTVVTVNGATVKGSVFGGSESGFVQDHTTVTVNSGIIGTSTTPTYGNVFGGGKGTASFAEAGRVRGNTTVAFNNGTAYGSVYGGGKYGDVGTINKEDANMNYKWTDATGQLGENYTYNNTGMCIVTVNGGEIKKHVFGAGKGEQENSFECERAMVYRTSVIVKNGKVDGNVYGGGEIGRVENNTEVTVGLEKVADGTTTYYTYNTGTDTYSGSVPTAGTSVVGKYIRSGVDGSYVYTLIENETSAPEIVGCVFGAGAGVDTHGYSALVRNNSAVTVQGSAKVRTSVYGGGQIATVGRYWITTDSPVSGQPTNWPEGMPMGMPYANRSGGECTVIVRGQAIIGPANGDASEAAGHVYGAGMGATPRFSENPKKMTPDGTLAGFTATDEKTAEQLYKEFLETLALVTTTHVTIDGATVKGSVYGGSESGFVQIDTDVKIQGDCQIGTSGTTTYGNIYGGGRGLSNFTEAGRVKGGTTIAVDGGTTYGSVYGGGELGIVRGAVLVNINDGTIEKDVYGGGALANTNTANVTSGYGTTSEVIGSTSTYKTTVNLLGGLIKGDAYGGGLGQLGTNPIEAKVYGDVTVTLGDESKTNATAFNISYYDGDHTNVVKSGRVFGCNNLNGSPKGNVNVIVWKTISRNADGSAKAKPIINTGTYEVAAVYGGGNLADYIPAATGAKASVEIKTCDVSVKDVYGGGNAAAVPETDVLINGAHEIFYVFGGGNGADPYTLNNGTTWTDNSGANIGITTTENVTIGSGKTNTLLKGGYVHEAYGGSNEKGQIKGLVKINAGTGGDCTLDCKKIVAAGRNADLDGDAILIMDCVDGEKVDQVIGGADNANVNGNVELTITSGTFGNVFGGNNDGGVIKGHIILNIEETGCTPIIIDNLYLGGNKAAYSKYGYYDSGTTNSSGKPVYLPRVSEDDEHTAIENPAKDDTHSFPYADPVLNIISCTKIGKVFGGGLGQEAIMYANPTVNINMIPGSFAEGVPAVMNQMGLAPADNPNKLGIIGDVYGGGDAADVIGDPTVNIGTAATVQLHVSIKPDGVTYNMSKAQNVVGAYISGNVFGAGMGKDDTFTCEKAMVGKDGDGIDNPDGGTTVTIYKGTVNGNVYGGGEVGRVEKNTRVTIGKEGDETSTPEIRGYVFGGGKGLETHGYSALVRGNPVVTVQGSAKVGKSVYGGGEIASVGNFFVKGVSYPEELHAPEPPEDFPEGMPYALKDKNSGKCTVIIRDKAEIGPDNMKMEKRDAQNNLLRPDNMGHVFGAGKGILPYEDTDDPKRMDQNSDWESYANNESGYITFIETLGMTASTNVTIGGEAFVKGSVYGGSENGHVLNNTKVTIAEKCQIGNGDGKNRRYTDTEWTNENPTDFAECASWPFGKKIGGTDENPIMRYLPYDVYDYVNSSAENPVPKPASDGHTYYGNVFGGGSGVLPYKKKSGWTMNEAKTAEVGQPVDANGYSDGIWLRSAGAVYGNTEVIITGGHILTSVYGGNECTDVGKYLGESTTPENETGICKITMSGGTIGVPRSETQITGHPVTCNLFGAGKGDQRINFNTWTNVGTVNVSITGGRIFGSVFGGGEDGHVIGNVTLAISEADAAKPTKIGTFGTTYMEGNVFGGGRGFSGEAQTAGTVGGNISLSISGGLMLGSVYGGGRLASVGTMFDFPTLSTGAPNPAYGNFKKDDANGTYGHITVNISGGTIGNENATGDGAKYSGNVFGGSMGRLELLNGTRNPIWAKMAQVKSTAVNIYGDNTVIRRNVYGGGELGTVRDNASVTIGGYLTVSGNDSTITASGSPTIRRDVYGGGYGSDDKNYTIFSVYELTNATADPTVPGNYDSTPHTYAYSPMQYAGCVGKNTYVNVAGGYIRKNVYGGGEMASVGVINYRAEQLTGTATSDKVVFKDENNVDYYYTNMVKHADATKEFALSWPYEFNYVEGYPGATHVNITGGRLGLKTDGSDNDATLTDNGDVYGAGKGKAGDFNDYIFCANVGSTDVKVAYSSTPTAYSSTDECIAGAVYGGGEDGHVMGNTNLTISGGLIYHSVYGGGSGKGKFSRELLKSGKTYGSTNTSDYETRDAYSITAGKVFGSTTVEMSDGYVVRNIYGGGNMGSVGKGNYAGGPDDYSTAGYGEKLPEGKNLWDKSNEFSQAFLNSGKCTVKISGGTVGYINESNPSKSMYPLDSNQLPYDASLPYGNVFGGCRGESVPNITDSPRYYYCPEFFVGYANETEVIIEGDAKILGSVYGGGMDGHVRRDASVIIKGGEIGIPYNDTNKGILGTDPDNIQWLARGNVYGAGSGIGKYGDAFCTSAGSVTRFTSVDVQGGTIHRNVYGGGSLSSIGAPMIGQDYYEYRKGTTGQSVGKQTLNEVVISGGQIGGDYSYDASNNHVYGGEVFGGSRGDASLDATTFSTSMFTSVTINANADATKSPVIAGNVYGGGEVGIVKGSVDVTMNGGTVNHDVYGGGALANTNTANVTSGYGTTSEVIGSTSTYTTAVNLLGGLISGDAYGGGLGRLAKAAVGTEGETGYQAAVTPVEAKVYGNVKVELNNNNNGGTADGEKTGCIVNRIFGCNNLNGTPKGKVQVYVYATQQNGENLKLKDKATLNTNTYDVQAVYGGGNLAAYVPANPETTTERSEVYIEGCQLTSIKQVYGGGNAASAPATLVQVNGTYEIDEVFGGGNGYDPYILNGNYYVNPGANVGYYNYTTPQADGTIVVEGTTYNKYKPVDNATPDCSTKDKRVENYSYGTGIAKLEVTGGMIHTTYGGSNAKGNIREKASSSYSASGDCDMQVDQSYGGGKDAPIDGEVEMVADCAHGIKEMFGGSKNADVDNDINLVITNGSTLERVFGGNNTSGAINGSITVTIEEGGCEPIKITDLYLGGYLAPYSVYGYEKEGNNYKTIEETDEQGNTIYSRIPLEAPQTGVTPKKDPCIYVISATEIGNIYGGGYKAKLVGNPHVNVNMTEGFVKVTKTEKDAEDKNTYPEEFTEGGKTYIYKDVANNRYNKDKVSQNPNNPTEWIATTDIGTIGNIYGGGNMADIIGNTYVEIGTGTYHDADGNLVTITPARNAAMITGNVFGGGKGVADTFECEKAMVGKNGQGFGSTNVIIGNGTVKGTVYGGGMIGRVENNTSVTIGLDNGTGEPVIEGNVFGAGKGLNTHGYSALVRGESAVVIQGNAKVKGSIYGGGEIASVGRYKIADAAYHTAHPDVEEGLPYALNDANYPRSGYCTVTVKGNAVIGPDESMVMNTTTHQPDDAGHVFGAGKGVLPYVEMDSRGAGRIDPSGNWESYENKEADYFKYIQTLALATQTTVTIEGNAFVKGSVYGGSENGFVQKNTNVYIKDGQIGCGKGKDAVYDDAAFINPATTEVKTANALAACDAWPYGEATGDAKYAPYDPNALTSGYYSTTESDATSAKGGYPVGDDGHTFYGNVFAGGSGYYPYAPGKWFRPAGQVKGNANLTITGGHILSNVYGGNEMTDVLGNSTITMSGGTVGVPRTAESIALLPTVGHLYGAGKGDKRIFFNTSTNVNNTSVNITGGTIYGNVYGGGEDGHVLGDAVTTISQAANKTTVIGSTGTSGFDGDVFGGGQGSVTALTAGVVGGNVNLNVLGGSILGSTYGGGRIASVGTYFTDAGAANYGKMQDDANGVTHGHINVALLGGTINQNVYGGCMGTTADDDLGISKNVTVNLNGVPYTTVTETQTLYTGWGLAKDEASSGTPYVVPDASKGCVVKGSIFGCNNVNSSPQGAVLVHVYKTQREKMQNGEDASSISDKEYGTITGGEFDLKTFDVQAVYGGGNLAAYNPVPTKATGTVAEIEASRPAATVIIDGCDRTSICHVYGGGNAASTPATNVTINGTFEIGELFGGGNGKDPVTKDGVTKPNPGANVGYKDYSEYYQDDNNVWKVKDKADADTKEERTGSSYVYGSGVATVNVFGGLVHRVFGGSNTKGNVRQTALTLLEEKTEGGVVCCDFKVDEAYGGGKSAAMDAEAKLLMACIPGLKEAYGGAEAADVQGGVTLNITNGTFERIFGGNNLSGTIRGPIEVNIEEVGCKPIIIGELYGGGNQAGYSVYGYKEVTDNGKIVWKPRESATDTGTGPANPYDDPVVNVKSFTSIGNIYGGGYGSTAVMVGNPTVNINEAMGDRTDYKDESYYMVGETKNYYYDDNGFKELTMTIDGHDVVLPQHKKHKIGAINNVFGGGNAADVIGNTNVNIGTKSVEYLTINDSAITVGTTNVSNYYTRSTDGKYVKATGTATAGTTYYREVEVIGADIRSNVYGGGNNAAVTGNTNVTIGKETNGN